MTGAGVFAKVGSIAESVLRTLCDFDWFGALNLAVEDEKEEAPVDRGPARQPVGMVLDIKPKRPPKNARRHSFVTYHVALHRNPGKTALIVSHRDQADTGAPSSQLERLLEIPLGCPLRDGLFTTEVWTWKGLVRYHVHFIIEVATRKVRVTHISCQWNESLILNVFRGLLYGIDGDLLRKRYLIMDRDPLFTKSLRRLLQSCGVSPVRYPPGEPLMNIDAERFVKSIKHECMDRLIFVGETSLQKAVREYAAHYKEERDHQGIDNNLINPRPGTVIPVGDPQAVEHHAEIVRTGRLGDMLNFYQKNAA